MEDKNPWNGSRKPCFHILNLTNNRIRHIYTSLNSSIPRMALPSPPPSKQCWDQEMLSGQVRVYRAADKLQHCLGAGGKGEKERNTVFADFCRLFFCPGWGVLDRFCTSGARYKGRTCGICNIATILKMKDLDRRTGKVSVSYLSLLNLSAFVGHLSLT